MNSGLIKTKAAPFQIKESGRVEGVKKFIARIKGLPTCMNGQVVEFIQGVKGMVIGFNQKDVMVLILGDEAKVRSGEPVYSKTESFNVPVGENFLGRIVNSLGEFCDGGHFMPHSVFSPVFAEAPLTMEIGELKNELASGIKIIDSITPLAKGQKQLIAGDRMTGKTAIAANVILNQKGKDVICVYCCIGKSFSDLLKIIQLLRQSGAHEYTIVVSAIASA
ncbi:MAG: F0F1 ATP synthase subunit alpha, partial [Candidatus Omnitrophota bacterium]|nr:F0F1 ATP synthase subunit alpha [Candidatus Omnitrophota bacterium]